MLSGCLISINELLSRKVIFKKPNIKNLNLYQSINQNVESRHSRLTSVNLLQIKLTIWSQSTATIQTNNIIVVFWLSQLISDRYYRTSQMIISDTIVQVEK